MDLDYCDIEWLALETNRDHSVFEIVLNFGLLLTVRATLFLAHRSRFKLNLPIPVPFSSLIPKMLIFIFVISCLTTSNLP